jgi:hypothetical protein
MQAAEAGGEFELRSMLDAWVAFVGVVNPGSLRRFEAERRTGRLVRLSREGSTQLSLSVRPMTWKWSYHAVRTAEFSSKVCDERG